MCILVKNKKLSTSESALKLYKVVSRKRFRYTTPYQSSPIPRKCIRGRMNFVADGDICPLSTDYDIDSWWHHEKKYTYTVGRGLVHCYVHLEDAIDDARTWMDGHRADYLVYEVEVPAGVEYMEGVLGYTADGTDPMDGCMAVAAREIRFVKRIRFKKD